jgi:hypothetical protein
MKAEYMKRLSIKLFIILMIGLAGLAGCKTPGRAAVVRPGTDGQAGTAELRGYALLPDAYLGADTEASCSKIEHLLRQAAEAGFGTVFFFMSDKADLLPGNTGLVTALYLCGSA